MDLLTTAKNIADRVEAESFKHDVPVAVTVIDIHGNIVLTHRMTGAPAFSLELSERKAYTSALVGMRTADLVPLVQPGAALYPLLAVSGGRYSAMGGGVPLTSDGQVIAGVGVSGGTTEQDVAVVEAAVINPNPPGPDRAIGGPGAGRVHRTESPRRRRRDQLRAGRERADAGVAARIPADLVRVA